jgi:hypothetical protein
MAPSSDVAYFTEQHRSSIRVQVLAYTSFTTLSLGFGASKTHLSCFYTGLHEKFNPWLKAMLSLQLKSLGREAFVEDITLRIGLLIPSKLFDKNF